MIPKIIHYSWLSNDPMPQKLLKCMASWKEKLPDYEIWLWNFERFPKEKSLWVQQAFDNKKYAFAADYIRIYALYYYGGIYLDSDVEVLKSFDDLLDLPYFLGNEDQTGIEAATFGCEKGFSLMATMLQYYEGRHFVREDGTFDTETLPHIFRKCIDKDFEYHLIYNKEEFIKDDKIINVFPVDYFSPKTWDTQEMRITNNTYSIHHFSGSWQPKGVRFRVWLRGKGLSEKASYIVAQSIFLPIHVVQRIFNGTFWEQLKKRMK